MQINSLTLSGTLNDVKTIDLQNGGKMVSLTMLCEEDGKTKTGEKFTKQMYIKLQCFGEMAKQAMNFHQGQGIIASGKLNVRGYEKKDGSKGLEVQLVPFALGSTGQVMALKPKGLAVVAQPSATPFTDNELDTIPF